MWVCVCRLGGVITALWTGLIAHGISVRRSMLDSDAALPEAIAATKRLLAATSDEFREALLGFEAPDEDDDE